MSKIHHKNLLNYLTGLRTEKDNLILSMEKYAKLHNVPILNWNSAEFLEQLILINNPKRVLEIGTAIGYSTIRIAKNLGKDSLIDTLELSKNNIPVARKNFSLSGYANKINLIEGDALTIMTELSTKYDFIFLDADKKDYKQLFKLALTLLKRNGVIFIDNLLWQGYVATDEIPEKYLSGAKHIKEFNKIFLNENSLKTTIIPVGDGIGLGIKKK